MSSIPSTLTGADAPSDDAAAAGALLIAIDGFDAERSAATAQGVRAALDRDFAGRPSAVFFADRSSLDEVRLAPVEAPARPPPAAVSLPWGSIASGGIPGNESALRALLLLADRRGAAAAALLAGEPHDDRLPWLKHVLEPVLEGYDCVCPTYLRHGLDGPVVTGLVYPLTRALYGRRLRQPLGGEVALSLKLVRHLLASDAWERDPLAAGSDPWLFAEALMPDFKVCQSVVGARVFRLPERQEASQALARVLGLLFREMVHRAPSWQRVSGSRPVETRGALATLEGQGGQPQVERLLESFQLGLANLQPLWGLVLNPSTLLSLKRAARLPAASFRLEDHVWARIVYDFAVAWFTRAMERGQLLHSITPLYLAWVASFANELDALAAAAIEARVESLCIAFEQEKPYLIARWRWPDRFNP